MPGLYTGPQSVDFEELRCPRERVESTSIEEKKNQQLSKLKLQNGLLILSNKLAKHHLVVQ